MVLDRNNMLFETPLCEIAYKYGTDKCPQVHHSYTPFYYKLLKEKKESFRKVVELGIGDLRMKRIMRRHGVSNYVIGASLYMWRDFFSNAQIYGADIVPEAMISGDRIKTFLCDERKKEDLEYLIDQIGSGIDLFVDDASHAGCDQVVTCHILMPLLKKDVVYIIEDVVHPRSVSTEISRQGYSCKVETFKSNVAVPKRGREQEYLILVSK